ncbi:hypothetical protein [Streptosporangium sp. NPDC051022]|uniref:hypothetical protein n=1 Tax=Streptosporangium sp. NPDC051022 TaxID=3155752 RepID=UPI003430AD0C
MDFQKRATRSFQLENTNPEIGNQSIGHFRSKRAADKYAATRKEDVTAAQSRCFRRGKRLTETAVGRTAPVRRANAARA